MSSDISDDAPLIWWVLEVLRKSNRGRQRNEWTVLLIDIDPELRCAGLADRPVQSRWLDLGRHQTRDDAWDCAEATLATRH